MDWRTPVLVTMPYTPTLRRLYADEMDRVGLSRIGSRRVPKPSPKRRERELTDQRERQRTARRNILTRRTGSTYFRFFPTRQASRRSRGCELFRNPSPAPRSPTRRTIAALHHLAEMDGRSISGALHSIVRAELLKRGFLKPHCGN
jgi:hypothetical protein